MKYSTEKLFASYRSWDSLNAPSHYSRAGLGYEGIWFESVLEERTWIPSRWTSWELTTISILLVTKETTISMWISLRCRSVGQKRSESDTGPGGREISLRITFPYPDYRCHQSSEERVYKSIYCGNIFIYLFRWLLQQTVLILQSH